MTSKMNIPSLIANLEAATYAYHNGLPLLMTDDEYDAAIDRLRFLDPTNPFLAKVGAPIATGDEVDLPIPLPSLNKIKNQEAIEKWSAKFPAESYHVSAKLDGCSALWFPRSRKLYTRGDGLRGRDISNFGPYMQGLVTSSDSYAVRGELIMRTDSPAVPAGKLARNIVAGALNRKEVTPALFAEIRFIAYEILANEEVSPEEGFRLMRVAGYEVARATIIPAKDLNGEKLSKIFSLAESKSPYQMDGIVVAPNLARAVTAASAGPIKSVNPNDRVAWKTRITASTATTTVISVEWNVSHLGFLIPRVLFEPVTLAGANIGAATGLHGRWIFENGIGPGAVIEVRRAGDVIPQIIAVHETAPTGPSMPARYLWDSPSGEDDGSAVHIKPVGDDAAAESATIQITHALGELGAENVGPGVVAKLYAAGFRSVGAIFAASEAEFAAKVEGCKGKMAGRIWIGLRAGQTKWTELNFMVASSMMPRGVGHTKLAPLLALIPNPATWPSKQAELKARRPAGLSDKTIEAIVAAIPAYLDWRDKNGLVAAPALALALALAASSGAATGAATGAKATGAATGAKAAPGKQMVVVFTGPRNKELEASLQAMGHIVADSVTKKTSHVVYTEGSSPPSSSKITKAQETGIPVLSLSEFNALLLEDNGHV